MRLGTASLASEPGGAFINVDRLDLRKYAARPLLARVLCDYLVYTEHNMKRALELCALATQVAEYQVGGGGLEGGGMRGDEKG